MTGLDLTRLPLMAFLTAGMVWAGPRWMASSWSLGVGQPDHDAHQRLLGERALLADLVEPLDDELLVSWRFWIPLVSLTRTLVPWMA